MVVCCTLSFPFGQPHLSSFGLFAYGFTKATESSSPSLFLFSLPRPTYRVVSRLTDLAFLRAELTFSLPDERSNSGRNSSRDFLLYPFSVRTGAKIRAVEKWAF